MAVRRLGWFRVYDLGCRVSLTPIDPKPFKDKILETVKV